MTIEDRFLTPDEIAGRVSLDRRTIYDLIRRGELPAYRFGRRVRIREADYLAWVGAAAQHG